MTAQDKTLHTLLRLRFGLIDAQEATDTLRIDNRVEYARFNRTNFTAVHTRLHYAVLQVRDGDIDCMSAAATINKHPALWA